MYFIPNFEVGILNAWIFIIPLLILHVISYRILIKRGVEGQSGEIMFFMFLVLHILPIFMPLIFNKIWFSLGLILYLSGMIFIVYTLYCFARTPINKPVKKGIFKITRNPMYLSGALIFIGISLVSISWVYLIFTVLWLIFIHFWLIPKEENECIKKYGDSYREYLKRTPKWIGFYN
jgi:protein-S-isoprenylcysteine O-methyltransferase Ste14